MRMNHWSDTRTRLALPPLKLLMVLALVLGMIGPSAMRPVRAAGPLYPDLATTKPSSLYFSRVTMGDGVSHHVLRLSNTVWNVGEGRLELQGDPNPNGGSRIYQNLYDHPTGGSRVAQEQVNSDLLYHPSHYHYHFSNFASYQLLQRDSNGSYQSTTNDGAKTSFCIVDYVRLNASGPAGERYTACSGTLQGLSVGWGDTYLASQPEQWIDLGLSPLANGSYAVQSTADPLRSLNEGGRFNNNVAITYFNVRDGIITIGTSTSPAPTGATGRVVNTGGSSLNCRTQPGGSIITRLAAGSTVPVTGAVRNGWYPVTCGGRAGWVSADYLQVSGTTTSNPTPTPTTPPTGTIGTVMNTGGASLNCRTQPGGSIITRLAAGTTVPVTGALRNGWYPVTCDDRSGWVSATYLKVGDGATTIPPEGLTGTVVNTGSGRLNCRTQPGGPIITTLAAGSTVTVTGATQNGWVPVVCADRSGWASAAYLQVSGGATPTPTPTPTPTATPTPTPGQNTPTATTVAATSSQVTPPPTMPPPTATQAPPTPTMPPPTMPPPTVPPPTVPPSTVPPPTVPPPTMPPPTVAPTATLEPTAEPTPTPEPEEPAAMSIENGSTVLVTDPGTDLRAEPSTEAAVVESLTPGTELLVTGPSRDQDGVVWWPVENPATDNTGWADEDFLEVKS